MKAKKLNLKALLIVTLAVGLILAGCARITPPEEEGSPEALSITAPSAPNDDVAAPPFNLTRHQYPEAASMPPEGYQLVQLGVKSLSRSTYGDGDDDDYDIVDPADGIWAGKFVKRHRDKKIKLKKNMIHLKKGCVPYDTWIIMTKPVENEPWVEFEPHGLVFDKPQTVKVKISYEDCLLPEGVQPEDLEVWYWNEELGEYEYMGGTNKINKQKIEFYIDHFSRYVVACQP